MTLGLLGMLIFDFCFGFLSKWQNTRQNDCWLEMRELGCTTLTGFSHTPQKNKASYNFDSTLINFGSFSRTPNVGCFLGESFVAPKSLGPCCSFRAIPQVHRGVLIAKCGQNAGHLGAPC